VQIVEELNHVLQRRRIHRPSFLLGTRSLIKGALSLDWFFPPIRDAAARIGRVQSRAASDRVVALLRS
jgi:hypothetical protein